MLFNPSYQLILLRQPNLLSLSQVHQFPFYQILFLLLPHLIIDSYKLGLLLSISSLSWCGVLDIFNVVLIADQKNYEKQKTNQRQLDSEHGFSLRKYLGESMH